MIKNKIDVSFMKKLLFWIVSIISMNQVDPVYKMSLNGLLTNSYSSQIQFTDSMIQSQKVIVNSSLNFSLFTLNTSKINH